MKVCVYEVRLIKFMSTDYLFIIIRQSIMIANTRIFLLVLLSAGIVSCQNATEFQNSTQETNATQMLNGFEGCNPEYSYGKIKDYVPPTFAEYKIKYSKFYESNEENDRCITYYKNVEHIAKLAREVTWEVGVSEFFDIDNKEWDNLRHMDVKEPDDSELQEEITVRVGAPAQLDYAKMGVVTSIKNQGSCGACWSFATCAYGQSRLIMTQNYSKDIDLSEQFLLDCTDGNSCDGGYLQNSFQKAADSGIPHQQKLPYQEKQTFLSFWSCLQLFTQTIGYIPKAYYRLKDSELIYLLQKGPVAISISSVGWTPYRSGIFSCEPGSSVDHAVLLVGYDSGSWLVKNQWGQAWGEKGYIRITRNPQTNCKIGTSAFIMYEKMMGIVLMGLILFGLLI